MTVGIVGLGLIGGSAGLVLKQAMPGITVLGFDNNPSHIDKALQLKLIDQAPGFDQTIQQSQIIILAIPVDATIQLLPEMLDQLTHQQVVMDMGSTKWPVIDAVKNHPLRKRFVAAHPMWGTEFSGPLAATAEAFNGKAAILCNIEECDTDAVRLAEEILHKLGLHLLYMNAAAHDLHTAYISHISHITSFALANTVLEKEKEESAIFELASAGFESTVRLAKSNPDMWLPIFQQNKENVLDVLNEHIVQLRKFKACLEKENWSYLYELMQQANNIKRILD